MCAIPDTLNLSQHPLTCCINCLVSSSAVSDSLRPHGLQHARAPCPSPTPGVHTNPRPSGLLCHPAISSSVVPFSCPQSFPASGSFPMTDLFPLKWCRLKTESQPGGREVFVLFGGNVRVFSKESALRIGWPKDCSQGNSQVACFVVWATCLHTLAPGLI